MKRHALAVLILATLVYGAAGFANAMKAVVNAQPLHITVRG
jgi:hypothetical protein